VANAGKTRPARLRIGPKSRFQRLDRLVARRLFRQSPRNARPVVGLHRQCVGLGLVGAGVFIAAVLWFGFSGGPVPHAVKAAIAAGEARLAGTGRLVIRKSGTEPVIRVMAEGEDQALVAEIVDEICAAVQAA